MSSKIHLVRSSLLAIEGDPDPRKKTVEFLGTVFEFGMDCVRGPHGSISGCLAANAEMRDTARAVAQTLLDKFHITHWMIDEISSRLYSHAEAISPVVACRTRSGLEFLVKDFAPNVRIYTGMLDVPPERRDWADSVPFKDYLDALLKSDTMADYDKRLRDWIDYYWEDEEMLRVDVSVPEGIPESHWWWREVSERV